MEEQKRIYRYYDKINSKYVRLEVTDEVAKFLQNNTKQWQRQQEDCYDYNVSLNKVLYEDDDDNPITLEDVVPDRTDEEIREFCEKCFRNQRLYRCVWNIVDKLTEKVGVLGTIGLGAGLFTGLKNVGKGKTYPFICFE